MNSPVLLKGTLTFETLRKATNMHTLPLTSHIWVAKWIALRCRPKDSFQPETIPHWTHSTSLSNQTSPSHNLSQTSLPCPSQPPTTSSCARTSPHSWNPPTSSHPWWPRRLLPPPNWIHLWGLLCQVGPTTCLGPVHFICFNRLSGCLLYMTTLFVFLWNKHEFCLNYEI